MRKCAQVPGGDCKSWNRHAEFHGAGMGIPHEEREWEFPMQEWEFWIRWEPAGPTPGLSKSPRFANLRGLGILVPGATHPPCFP
jgi:hypothetical protein